MMCSPDTLPSLKNMTSVKLIQQAITNPTNPIMINKITSKFLAVGIKSRFNNQTNKQPTKVELHSEQ